tara:strand:+ start:1155 stop:1466 length:312 start_codon:yes stop_codon:yes gene_type:complete
MYYNTTNETGKTLTKSWDKSKTQEDRIMDYFRHVCRKVNNNYKERWFKTPFDVCEAFDNQYPITSIRRAMTNLTAKGKLRKTAAKGQGRYGKMNFCWTLNEVN